MSKVTIFLLTCLVLVVGIMLYIMYWPTNNSFIASVSAPIRSVIAPANTTLSFAAAEQAVIPGQTVALAVTIHNPTPPPALVQLEIGYDPTMLTVESVVPGSFFANPAIALQRIDYSTGRISYALRCPDSGSSNKDTACVNSDSSTVAVITVRTNPYILKPTTTLSFLPKTVVRTSNGRNILQKTTPLNLSLGRSLYPAATRSALASPGANYIRVNPVH